MGIFLVYILKSALCLAAFYLFYRLLLSRETLHRFNRAVLLGVLALSAVVPLIEVSTEQPSGVGQGMMSLEQWLAMADAMADASPVVVEQSRSVWPLALLAVYALGVLVFFGRNVCSLFRLGQLLRGTRREDIRRYVPDASGVLLLVRHRPPRFGGRRPPHPAARTGAHPARPLVGLAAGRPLLLRAVV